MSHRLPVPRRAAVEVARLIKGLRTSHADRRTSSAGNRGGDCYRPWHRPHAVNRVAHPPIATAARKARRRLRGDDSRIRAQPPDVRNRGDRVLRVPWSDRHRCARPLVAGLRSQPVDRPRLADSVARGFHRHRRGVLPRLHQGRKPRRHATLTMEGRPVTRLGRDRVGAVQHIQPMVCSSQSEGQDPHLQLSQRDGRFRGAGNATDSAGEVADSVLDRSPSVAHGRPLDLRLGQIRSRRTGP